MEAVAWSALGLLATAFAVLTAAYFRLGDRIDHNSARLDALAARLDARLDAMSARLDDHIGQHWS